MSIKSSLKRFWRSKSIYFSAVLISCIIIIIFLIFGHVFRVKIIEIINEKSFSLNGLDNYKNINIFTINEKKINQELINLNPQIKKITLVKIYPNKLNLFIELDNPIAAFKVDQGFFLLSKEGKILSKKKKIDGDFPIINYYQKINFSSSSPGNILDNKDLLLGLYFLADAVNLGLKIDTIDISGFNMIGLNMAGRSIFFTVEKDRQIQEYQFKTIIRQFKIEGKNFKRLDLRFDKPVIELEN